MAGLCGPEAAAPGWACAPPLPLTFGAAGARSFAPACVPCHRLLCRQACVSAVSNSRSNSSQHKAGLCLLCSLRALLWASVQTLACATAPRSCYTFTHVRTHTHTHTHTCAHTHTRACAHTHTRTRARAHFHRRCSARATLTTLCCACARRLWPSTSAPGEWVGLCVQARVCVCALVHACSCAWGWVDACVPLPGVRGFCARGQACNRWRRGGVLGCECVYVVRTCVQYGEDVRTL